MSSLRLRRLFVGAIVATLAVALVAAPAVATTPQQSSETTTVRLGFFANVTHAPALVASRAACSRRSSGRTSSSR